MKKKILKKGFVVITPTLCQGDTMSWSTEDDKGNTIPIIFDTKKEAWQEIADGLTQGLKQFIDGERDYEDTDFATDEYVARYTEYSDGRIVVSSTSDEDVDGPEDTRKDIEGIIIETTLEKWRADR